MYVCWSFFAAYSLSVYLCCFHQHTAESEVLFAFAPRWQLVTECVAQHQSQRELCKQPRGKFAFFPNDAAKRRREWILWANMPLKGVRAVKHVSLPRPESALYIRATWRHAWTKTQNKNAAFMETDIERVKLLMQSMQCIMSDMETYCWLLLFNPFDLVFQILFKLPKIQLTLFPLFSID